MLRSTGNISAKSVASHRNGISGEPFYVILFTENNREHRGEEPQLSNKMAVVFEAPGHCAIFDTDLLTAGNVAFGENSWRGDVYEPIMRRIITEWEKERDAEMDAFYKSQDNAPLPDTGDSLSGFALEA